MSAPQSTAHSGLRFTVRSNGAEISVDKAWEMAFPVKVEGEEGARTRYHSPTDTILYARGSSITTVKQAEFEKWYSAHTSSCSHCEETYNPIEQGLTCPHCGHDNHD